METLSPELSGKMDAALARAQALRASMTRDEAFALLEAAHGPDASYSIVEHRARYAFQRDAGQPESVDWTVGYAKPGEQFQVFIRPTLSEAVAAAVAHKPFRVALPQLEEAA